MDFEIDKLDGDNNSFRKQAIDIELIELSSLIGVPFSTQNKIESFGTFNFIELKIT